MENYIKEGKLGFAFGKMSSTEFEINETANCGTGLQFKQRATPSLPAGAYEEESNPNDSHTIH